MASPIFLLGPDPSNQCCGCETRSGPCDPCTGCFFTLPYAVGSGPLPPYTSQADAQYQIDHFTVSCLSQTDRDLVAYDEISMSFAGGILSYTETQSSVIFPDITDEQDFRISASAGTISLTFTLTANEVYDEMSMIFTIFADDGVTLVGQDFKAQTGTITMSGTLNVTLPADGNYYMRAIISTIRTSPSFPVSITLDPCKITATNLQVCKIQAAYDDGSGLKYLACSTI